MVPGGGSGALKVQRQTHLGRALAACCLSAKRFSPIPTHTQHVAALRRGRQQKSWKQTSVLLACHTPPCALFHQVLRETPIPVRTSPSLSLDFRRFLFSPRGGCLPDALRVKRLLFAAPCRPPELEHAGERPSPGRLCVASLTLVQCMGGAFTRKLPRPPGVLVGVSRPPITGLQAR